MKRQITYLISGEPHLPYLVASLYTLRRHWTGDVVIHAWPESYNLAVRIGGDPRLGIADVRKRERQYKRRNAQFFDKINLFQTLDADVALYLDCDTTVHGDIELLFDAAAEHGFAATQFNDWTTADRKIRGRIESLRQFPDIDPVWISATLGRAWPSVNGGVWACRPDSPVLPVWEAWSLAAKATFIPDEKVLHVLQAKFNRCMTTVCGDGRWNSSPKFQSKTLADCDVVIRHYHGDSCVRPSKSKKGFDLWRPLFDECLYANLGGVRDWYLKVGNRWIDELERIKQNEKNGH